MRRLLVHVEGQTEEAFVNNVLAPHLYAAGWSRVDARLVGNARARGRRGGITSWASAQRDIVGRLCEDPACFATTMVDYYALPRDWPGRITTTHLAAEHKGTHVQSLVEADIQQTMGGSFHANRFKAFVVMHEFEALLFSDCDSFSQGIGRPDLRGDLQSIRDTFHSPEEINDSPLTAPSKRVETLFPEYQKVLYGSLAALEIGLAQIRAECPHFGAWLTHLESLAGTA